MKGIKILLTLVTILLLAVVAGYSACPGTYYCDNTEAEVTKECSVPAPGTYNGSFANKPAWHNWTLVTTGTYVNFTSSIQGEADDDLNLRIYLPNGSYVDLSGPGSSKVISVCSNAGTYKSRVEAFKVPDFCAPYNITFFVVGVSCCQDYDCNDGKDCSLDTCSSGGCLHCTKDGYNVTTCNNYACCSGLQQCFDGVCKATCPDFNISLTPTSLSITVPQSGYNSSKSRINVSSINDFNSPVSFSGSWIGSSPTGVTFYFTPTSVTPPANGNAYANVTINVSSTASTGTYTLRINATSGFSSKYADLTVNILPSPAAPFDFNVTVSPSSGSVVQGSWVNTTVTVTLVSGTPQTVYLYADNCPPDATCSFLPSNSGTPTYSRTLNISTSYSTPNGTYQITVRGVAGSLTKTATYTLEVTPSPTCVRANPVVTISPTYGYGRAGQTLTYTVNVTNKDSTACGESTFSLVGIVPSGFSYSFSQPTLVIKPVGFSNSNTSYFYVTSNCTSTEYYYHPIRVNVTNTNDPAYFTLSGYSYYYVYYHFDVSLLDSGSSVSGATRSYRVYVYNYKWTTCPASNFSLVGLPDSVPAGWSYVLGPSSVVVSPGSSSTLMRFNVTSPCSAAPGSYTVRINVSDNSTNINKTASGTYNVSMPSCSITSTPFFSTGPFSSTLTATFYNLNTTCFPTATLNCGQGTYVNRPISGSQASTTCSYPAVGTITYYTARVNVSANTNIVCQTTVVDNPNVFNFSISVSPTPSYNGLVGFWPFDEGWGISSADKSGYRNNASLGVTNWEYVPAWTLGKFGYALKFDGSNDYVDAGNSSILNPSSTGSLTVEAWIYPLSFGGGGLGRIISKETGAIANPYALELRNTSSTYMNGIIFCIGNGASETCTDTGCNNIITLNTWQHVVGRYNRTHLSVFVNGVERCNRALTNYNFQQANTNLLIGNNPSNNRQFNGIIDEVRIWNRSLSDQEILLHYQLAKVPQGQEHFANISTTLLSGPSLLVELTLDGCPPNTQCTLTPNVGYPTYASILKVSTSAQTPIGIYNLTIRGTNGTLTKEMNYTIEVLGVCARSNPELVINPSSQTGNPGEELSYSIHLTNKDSFYCSPSQFTLELQPLFDATGWSFNGPWLSGWRYKQAITINNTLNSNTLTNYQVLVSLDTRSLISAGKMRSDCGDIRFVDSDGGLISYWLESGCNSDCTRIWVKVPSIPGGSTKMIYFYYGNSAATTQSNGTATFEFFDDFDDGVIDSSKWTGVQRATEENGYFRGDGGNEVTWANSVNSFNAPMIVEFEMKPSYTSGDFDSGIRVGNLYFVSDRVVSDGGTGSPCISTGWCYPSGSQDNNWHTYQVVIRSSSQEFKDLSTGLFATASYSYSSGYIYLIGDSDNSIYDTLYNWIRVRKYAYPEPIAQVGILLSPQESIAISLKVNSSATAANGDYMFNLTAYSATGSASAVGIYSISTPCQGLPDGTCIANMQVCINGIPRNSCGDGKCNCGENEITCNSDCGGVYYMLKRDWHLISLPYKNIVSISSENCHAHNLSFFYYENYTWKKVIDILNIKGGYGYWVNPSWFTKAEYCTINLTVDRSNTVSVQDIPKLKKGFNAIGSTYDQTNVEELKCIDDFGNQVPIRVVYYWDIDKKWKVASSITQQPPWYYGYWIYVDEDCKLTK